MEQTVGVPKQVLLSCNDGSFDVDIQLGAASSLIYLALRCCEARILTSVPKAVPVFAFANDFISFSSILFPLFFFPFAQPSLFLLRRLISRKLVNCCCSFFGRKSCLYRCNLLFSIRAGRYVTSCDLWS